MVFFTLLFSLVYLIWWYVTPWVNQPIRDVLVTGQHVPASIREDLRERMLLRQLDRYFTVNINAVKSITQSSVWVDEARVSRVWPDRLVVDVAAPVFVARWGDEAFLDHHWQVVKATSQWVPSIDKLPTLKGPEGQSAHLANLFTRMNAILAKEKLSIQTLTMAERGAVDLVLNNQVKLLLGREKIQSRLKRIVELYTNGFIHDHIDVVSIDGRYDHGVAVKTKAM